jgi:hypothetical protein
VLRLGDEPITSSGTEPPDRNNPDAEVVALRSRTED